MIASHRDHRVIIFCGVAAYPQRRDQGAVEVLDKKACPSLISVPDVFVTAGRLEHYKKSEDERK
jgi:hypothetical protein